MLVVEQIKQNMTSGNSWGEMIEVNTMILDNYHVSHESVTN